MKPKLFFKRGIAVLGLTLGCLPFIKGSQVLADDDHAPSESAASVVTVQTGTIKRMTLHSYVSGYGMISAAPATGNQPAAGSLIAAPSAGVVAKVNVIEGQQIKKGETLAELNAGTVTYTLAAAELQRQRKLFAQHNASQKELQTAEAQLDSLRVISPLAGTITRLNVVPGQAVDASTVVAEVMDLNRLAVAMKIPESQAGEIKPGNPVHLGDGQGRVFASATLSYVSPAVNVNDGTVSASALLPPNSGLRPGQFVQLKIVTAVHTNSLAVPVESVVTDATGQSVIALVKGDTATQMPVQTGFRENGWVEVTADGLSADASIVTVGAYGLPKETKIQIANTPEETSADKSSRVK